MHPDVIQRLKELETTNVHRGIKSMLSQFFKTVLNDFKVNHETKIIQFIKQQRIDQLIEYVKDNINYADANDYHCITQEIVWLIEEIIFKQYNNGDQRPMTPNIVGFCMTICGIFFL